MKLGKNRDYLTILFICFAVACLMTACMNSATDANPETTRLPEATRTVPAVTTPAPYDWAQSAKDVESRLSQISEVSDARVVVVGNTALVAVKFAPAYQGEMTSRIREMISGEIMKADPEIKTVAVTATNEDVTRVYGFADRIRGGEAADTFENDINEIIRNATTLT